jgi:hypothetical protein
VRPLNFTVRIQETPMLVLLKFIATFAAAMFAGAALYVNVAEHPARMTLDTRFAAAQWAPSYRRATWMQAPLALLSLVAGLGSWLLGGGLGWALAALLIGGVVPFTFIEHHVYEQGITCAGSRSRYSGDAFFARALGEASRGENGA